MSKIIVTLSALFVISIIFLIITLTMSTNDTPADYSGELTKQEFINKLVSSDENFSNGGFIYSGDLKFDVEVLSNGTNKDSSENKFRLIVYGIKKENYKPFGDIKEQGGVNINSKDFTYWGTPEFYSGYTISVASTENGVPDGKINAEVTFYVDNVLPGFTTPSNIVDASLNSDIDAAKYIYPTITTGDINNDGKINSIDASLILKAYSYISTGNKIMLNKELFDFDQNGKIDSSDASAVLYYYNNTMT